VQEVFPPVGRDKLRQHHGQVSSIALTFHPVSMGPPGTPDARPAIRYVWWGPGCPRGTNQQRDTKDAASIILARCRARHFRGDGRPAPAFRAFPPLAFGLTAG
jgi:hypothetical protein